MTMQKNIKLFQFLQAKIFNLKKKRRNKGRTKFMCKKNSRIGNIIAKIQEYFSGKK
jgi:hypothetical protein